MREASLRAADHKFSLSFLLAEWEQVVDAWQLQNWETYRDVARLGRKTRLPEAKRQVLWSIFEDVRANLAAKSLMTESTMFARLADDFANRREAPFDFAVVDEAQDIGVPQMRFLAAMGGDRANALFFAGDLGQRIFQQLDQKSEGKTGHISISTMHLAKGLEFRAVVVMACDDEIIPLQKRIENVGDDADLQEVYDTERHLLYVACTRARDNLLITSVEPASEFLDDLRMYLPSKKSETGMVDTFSSTKRREIMQPVRRERTKSDEPPSQLLARVLDVLVGVSYMALLAAFFSSNDQPRTAIRVNRYNSMASPTLSDLDSLDSCSYA